MQDSCLRIFLDGRYVNLQINDTVASGYRTGLGPDGIVIQRIVLVRVSAVLLAVDHLRITCTYIFLADDERNRIYLQIQAVELLDELVVGVKYRIRIDTRCVE